MRHQQIKYIIGHVTIRIIGNKPEKFVRKCLEAQLPMWNVTFISKNKYEATVYKHHVKEIKKLSETSSYVVELIEERGIFVKLRSFFARKEWVLACAMSIGLLFLLANTAWKVEITGVPMHIEHTIEEQLEDAGLYEGAWIRSLQPLELVQEQLLHEIPDLLYIGIEQRGTSYYIDAIEKKMENEDEEKSSDKLVAKKSGMIEKMFIQSGVPLVARNDMVKKGDTLVTNEVELLEEEENEGEDEKDNKKTKKVPVKGKVYANTWYHIKGHVALNKSQASLTGENKTSYQLQLGNITVPIWGWNKQPYQNQIAEYDSQSLRLWAWTLPINFVKKDLYEYESNTIKLSESQVQEKMMEHVEENVKRTFGQDTEVLKYYVLHETVENGKVNMNLYVSLKENIAKSD